MINMIPGYYRNSKVLLDLYAAFKQAFDKIDEDIAIEDLKLFITTTDEFELHEKDVCLSPITADIETKRSRVLARIHGNSLLTKAELERFIMIYDKTGCTVNEDFEKYTVTVVFSGRTGQPYNFNEIQSAIEEVKPAHIKIVYEFIKNTWLDARNKLGTWNNALKFTWGDIQNYDGRTWLYVNDGNVYLRENGANAYVVFIDDVPYARLL